MSRRCDGYELMGIPELKGVTFCRKDGARRVHELWEELRELRAAQPKKKPKKRCKNCRATPVVPISAGGECSLCGTENAYANG